MTFFPALRMRSMLKTCEQEKMISTSRAPCCRARCCSLAPRSDEHEDNRNFAEHGKEHFQLSQKSYAKLIAYCESRKILSAHRGCSRAAAGNPTADSRRYSTVSPIHERANEVCRILARVLETVEECPWHWGGISGQDAKRKLRGTPPGTFLLRDSADPRFLYSLSLMTKSGPTSIRIVYNGGRFRFDSERDDVTSESRHPRSDTERRSCVVHMILRYTEYLRRHNELCNNSAATSRGDEKSDRGQFMCYWMDNGGRREIPVLLTHPLPKKLISLQHSTRICLNKKYRIWETPELVDKFPLPVLMKSYIKKYPYPV
uniref:Suppressor of cytokine signaling 2 n=1 Tax=Ciona savignyi TaxID=51511 RepID=H2YJG2_CIOSA